MYPYFMLLLSPICWASWLNFKLICKDWRFESFYVNYAWCIVFWTFAYGCWTAGSPSAFLGSFESHNWTAVAEGILAGSIWGVGNILLVAAIVLCGLAVGLKIAIGLSLVLGVTLTYVVNPTATHSPLFLVFGAIVVSLAILANGTAYRVREEANDTQRSYFRRGMTITIVCGIFIGVFPLFQGLAIKEGLDGAQIAFLLTVGDVLVAIPLLPYLMRHPLIPQERPLSLVVEYRRAKPLWHLWAILAGFVWAIGTIANLVVAVEDVGLSIAWAIGECSPLVGLLWGILVFKEFVLEDKQAQRKAYELLTLTFVLYGAGIVLLFMAA